MMRQSSHDREQTRRVHAATPMTTQRSQRPWSRIRNLILDHNTTGRCHINGPHCTTWATTVDHIIPITDGGTDHPANLRPACAACNQAGGARITNRARRRRASYETTVARYVSRF
jgi:5-methylcytosine-specific restriction endonuclease McrA